MFGFVSGKGAAMNTSIIFGLFAFSVAIISLIQVLTGQQDNLLALLRRFWGRPLGHSLYFLSHVAIPVVVCILCLGWGIRHYDSSLLVMEDTSSRTHEVLRMEIKEQRELQLLFPRPDLNFQADLFLAA